MSSEVALARERFDTEENFRQLLLASQLRGIAGNFPSGNVDSAFTLQVSSTGR